MDEACLATYLAESMFVPSILLQDYISFEEISDYEVKAIIRHGGQTASGIFAFNEQYEFVSFTTNDRAVSNTDGSMEYILILSILVYTFFSRMFDLMLPPVAKHSIVVA